MSEMMPGNLENQLSEARREIKQLRIKLMWFILQRYCISNDAKAVEEAKRFLEWTARGWKAEYGIETEAELMRREAEGKI